MLGVFKKFFDYNQKEIDRLQPLIHAIGEQEQNVKKLKDREFAEKTAEFKVRLTKGETLDDILVEAFALVREAARRQIGERHYDVQLIAATVLHQGKVAEQKTGEGKTLSAVPALYLNALTGRGVHLVTVNDYLVRRDAGWMGAVFHLLGLSTGAMIHDQSFLYDPAYEDKEAQDWRIRNLRPATRKQAYDADITYGINSEFGFDYLRDNMVSDVSQIVQRGYHFAIVDEVDSVLIDEARTPHIISAPDMEPTQKYYTYAQVVDKLSMTSDYQVDEKLRTAHLTEQGIKKVEKLIGVDNLYEKDFETVHHVEAALKARALFRKDKEYVVKDNQIIIVDEFTGRLLPGRRYSEGLHQALEAKESVTIQQESKTLATVSLQNFFRMYEKLAGMTGTAATEAEEFHKIYKLDVVTIPTSRPTQRKDHADMIYKTIRAKYGAVARSVEEAHKTGQPVLVGTTSIEHNEIVSQLLTHKKVPHKVLNAKQHEQEALIIAEAGKKGAVTVATNMAGRGVDILLGGIPPNKYEFEGLEKNKDFQKQRKEWEKAHDDVKKTGGLYVIGTERHESRRIDNQLRGRSGRQGDPGTSRFFISLEDDLMRIFGGERIASLMTMFKLEEDVPLEHPMVSKAIEQAQVKVEGFNFDSRKHLVEYDDVLNKQREIVYQQRRKVLESQDGTELKKDILKKIQRTIDVTVQLYAAQGFIPEEQEKVVQEYTSIIPLDAASIKDLHKQISSHQSAESLSDLLTKAAHHIYEQNEEKNTPAVMRQVEKWVALNVIDNYWMDHLTAIEDLRGGIGLRGYGQRDPLIEYKNEAFSMFERLMASIDDEIVHRIYKVQVNTGSGQQAPSPLTGKTALQEAAKHAVTNKDAGQEGIGNVAQAVAKATTPQTAKATAKPQPVRNTKKLNRNDPCWCGSGKKWKKCHYPQTS